MDLKLNFTIHSPEPFYRLRSLLNRRSMSLLHPIRLPIAVQTKGHPVSVQRIGNISHVNTSSSVPISNGEQGNHDFHNSCEQNYRQLSSLYSPIQSFGKALICNIRYFFYEGRAGINIDAYILPASGGFRISRRSFSQSDPLNHRMIARC